jgi:hypothetical protein
MKKLLLSRYATTGAGVMVAAAAVSAAAAQSHSLRAPLFPTSEPVANRIVVEEEYGFSVRRYTPAVELKPVPRGSANYETPEATTIAMLSAMATRDLDWFRSLWDAESARLMEEKDKQQGHDAAFWTSTWDKAFRNRRITITTRIDTGKYVLIGYELNSLSADGQATADVIQLDVPLKQVDGRWLGTQELSNDPVLLYWKTPTVRPHRVIRGVQP